MHPNNIDLYNEVKEHANDIYKKPSAYKSGFIIKEYKRLGGTFKNDNTEKPLKRWYLEKWKDIADLDYPVYRPTKRINSKTPLTVNEIDKNNLKKQILLKQVIKGEHNLPKFKKNNNNVLYNMPRKLSGGSLKASLVQEFITASYMKKNKRPQNIGAFGYYEPGSTDTVAVYANQREMRVVIVYRGTEGTISDWANNWSYAVGQYKKTERFKEAERVTNKVKELFKFYKITTIGHSQGAVPQRLLNGNDIEEAIAVNPAVMGEKPRANETRISSTIDPVSNAFDLITKGKVDREKDKTIFIPAETSDPIGEHSQNILERIGDQEVGKKFEGSGLNRYATANYLLSLYK